tara:strand:+ start:3172 stop:3492 length:321 start_codon:yes stop_codon:yes gene_type:complete
MAKYFNITGETSAAAELTRELLAPGDNFKTNSISLTNVHADTKCTVNVYIEKVSSGKFYILKNIELPIGVTLVHNFTFDNSTDQYGLYLKLTKSASETPAVDVILK